MRFMPLEQDLIHCCKANYFAYFCTTIFIERFDKFFINTIFFK